jgi:hypothetical protein
LNTLLNEFYFQISQLTHCLITFGTSWVYRNLENNQIVANCHKVPQKQFTKELLSVDTIAESIQNSIDLIQSINPKVNFTFTVSPVRHIKDGYVENTLSKAHLTTAIHKIVNSNIQIPNSNSEILNPKSQILNYFPSYEIMMDELRDYRFYNPDMLHPNSVAIDYIWERFVTTSIADKALTTMKEVASIQSGLQHRPFNPYSEAHQQFLSKLQDRISLLQKQFPEIQF